MFDWLVDTILLPSCTANSKLFYVTVSAYCSFLICSSKKNNKNLEKLPKLKSSKSYRIFFVDPSFPARLAAGSKVKI